MSRLKASKTALAKIKCRACKPGDSGCRFCGGYKVIIAQIRCPSCAKKYWQRPGVHTVYDGKVFYSIDGVKITAFLNRKWVCQFCEDRCK